MSPYVYVASSWRNARYPLVVQMLRGAGAQNTDLDEPDFGVHDFRDEAGHFTWRSIDPEWESWDREAYVEKIQHPAATIGFERDMGGLRRATACLLVTPCGRSAHLELGHAVGRGLRTAIYLTEEQEPELMYRMVDEIITSPTQLMGWAFDVLGVGDAALLAALEAP